MLSLNFLFHLELLLLHHYSNTYIYSINFLLFFLICPKGQQHISLGALGDSFYEYLLKVWIQSGQTDSVARQMYDEAMEAIVNNIIQTSPGGLIYASDSKCTHGGIGKILH